jgi:histidinol phosphatase-like PHP family hydrolase
MDWALQRNIPFTLGSDSHHPDMVGQFFHEIIPQFRAAGLPAIHYFRNRKRFTLEFR